MAGETQITLVGNLTADPELRFTASGAPVASFTIASTPRTFDRATGQFKDGEALFMRCTAWREMADNVAQSLTKGMRVVATGRLQQRSFETQQGEKRTVVEMQVDEIGPSLRYASAQVKRNPRQDGGASGFGGNGNGGGQGYGGGNGYGQSQSGAPAGGAPQQSGYGQGGGYYDQQGGNPGGPRGGQPGGQQSGPGGYGYNAPEPFGADQQPWGAGPADSSFDDEPPF